MKWRVWDAHRGRKPSLFLPPLHPPQSCQIPRDGLRVTAQQAGGEESGLPQEHSMQNGAMNLIFW